MASTSRKIHSRRRLAALTFLSNISLDGTHRDTNLYNLNFNLFCNKTINKLERVPKPEVFKTEQFVNTVIEAPSNFSEKNTIVRSFDFEENIFQRKLDEFVQSDTVYQEQPPSIKSRDRVQKFVSDAKARLCNLSQKRKQLSHQKSTDSYGIPSGKSMESLGCCRSRKASLCPSECSAHFGIEIKFVCNTDNYRNEAERMVLVSEKKSPVVLFSVLPYHRPQFSTKGDSKLEGSRRRHASSRQLSIINDGIDPLDLLILLGVEKPMEGQEISYGKFLSPSYFSKKGVDDISHWYPNPFAMADVPRFKLMSTPLKNNESKGSDKEDVVFHPCHSLYHPNLIDDPELNAGKHSTLLVFPSYITSVINYVKPSDLKKDLNERFKEKFPHIPLTLSKLRSLKREMYKIVKVECNIDLSVVAQAFVYFEKLVLKVLVNKQNRKLCAGACLLLSAKLNDVSRSDLQILVEKIETIFRINRKDLMCLEFGVLVALEFSLLSSTTEILPHYHRLMYES